MKSNRTKPSKSVPAFELSNLRMVAGNENKVCQVIDNGRVKTWVGIGWIDEREATEEDVATLPKVSD